jgi:hypothetical protein
MWSRNLVHEEAMTQWGLLRQIQKKNCTLSRSPLPRRLRRSLLLSLADTVGSNPAGEWTFACCECYVLSGTGLYDEMITRLEESYRLWCVVECDQEISRMRKPWSALCRSATAKKTAPYSKKIYINNYMSSWYSAQFQPVIKGAEYNKKNTDSR